ncbi:MAG TPA: VCBS repeat-containing protein [Planctomycetota bacterium]|nr:VCBS repeat-containing protein [Planctomycetota bacterium]
MRRAAVVLGTAAILALCPSLRAQGDVSPPSATGFVSFQVDQVAELRRFDAESSNLVDVDGDGDLDLVGLRNKFTLSEPAESDEDGDGVPELSRRQRFLSAEELALESPVLLALNDGAGRFAVRAAPLLPDAPWGFCGSSWCDYDRDGDDDVLLWEGGELPPHVYRNDGALSFARASMSWPAESAAGARDPDDFLAAVGGPAIWCDANADGLADVVMYSRARLLTLVCTDAGGFEVSATQELLDAAKPSGTSRGDSGLHGARPTTLAAADIDHDGDQDVVVADFRWSGSAFDGGRGGGVVEFHNDGAARFELSITLDAGRFGEREPAGVCFVDLDGDGWKDLVQVNCAEPQRRTQHAVFRNEKGQGWTVVEGAFQDQALRMQFRSCFAADFDADGDQDLLLDGNINWCTRLVENLGGMRFRVATKVVADSRAAIDCLFNQSPVAIGDVDGDEDLDLILEIRAGLCLYRNTLR